MTKAGWFADKYFILFASFEKEIYEESRMQYLPECEILGLLGWQDFIIAKGGNLYTIPTVPIDWQYSEVLETIPDPGQLEHDPEINGQIKWLVHPLAFGGSPTDPANVTWTSDHALHAKAVKYWNALYTAKKAEIQ